MKKKQEDPPCGGGKKRLDASVVPITPRRKRRVRRRFLDCIAQEMGGLTRYTSSLTKSVQGSLEVTALLITKFKGKRYSSDAYTDDHIRAYVFRSARNLSIDWLRKNRRREGMTHYCGTSSELPQPDGIWAPSAEETIDETDRWVKLARARIERLGDNLDAVQKDILRMLLDGQDIPEIAKAIGLPESTIRKKRRSAIEKLKRMVHKGHST